MTVVDDPPNVSAKLHVVPVPKWVVLRSFEHEVSGNGKRVRLVLRPARINDGLYKRYQQACRRLANPNAAAAIVTSAAMARVAERYWARQPLPQLGELWTVGAEAVIREVNGPRDKRGEAERAEAARANDPAAEWARPIGRTRRLTTEKDVECGVCKRKIQKAGPIADGTFGLGRDFALCRRCRDDHWRSWEQCDLVRALHSGRLHAQPGAVTDEQKVDKPGPDWEWNRLRVPSRKDLIGDGREVVRVEGWRPDLGKYTIEIAEPANRSALARYRVSIIFDHARDWATDGTLTKMEAVALLLRLAASWQRESAHGQKWSGDEIGDHLGVTRSTANTHAHRGVAKVRALLADNDDVRWPLPRSVEHPPSVRSSVQRAAKVDHRRPLSADEAVAVRRLGEYVCSSCGLIFGRHLRVDPATCDRQGPMVHHQGSEGSPANYDHEVTLPPDGSWEKWTYADTLPPLSERIHLMDRSPGAYAGTVAA